MTLNRRLLIITIVLALTIGVRAYVSNVAPVPPRTSLTEFPSTLGEWHQTGEDKIAADVAGVLRADDTINRRYRDAHMFPADLFIAYYKTQKAGESMHSPKNCLPGSGWSPVLNDLVTVKRNGVDVDINRYVIEKDGSFSLVLYWYQAGGRVIANEYWGKYYLVYDAIKTQRRDGSIVRIVVPMRRRDDLKPATEVARAFASQVMEQTASFLP